MQIWRFHVTENKTKGTKNERSGAERYEGNSIVCNLLHCYLPFFTTA
jgi:hypothetical protein